MNEDKKISGRETLQFAVYGGISGMIGLVSLLLLFFTAYRCQPEDITNAIINSIISISLGVLTINFGRKASNNKQGISMIILGVIILIFVIIMYITEIIPCILR